MNPTATMFLTVHLVAFLCVQVMGKVPTISINKTDGCHVYLSKDSLSCEIVSAKSSEMNILVPGNDGDFVSILSGRSFKKKKVLEEKSGDILYLSYYQQKQQLSVVYFESHIPLFL